MRVKTIRPAFEPIELLNEEAFQFAIDCSPQLQTEEDVREMVQRLQALESAQTLLAIDDQSIVGWLSVIAWPGDYATLHPLRGASPGWPTILAGKDEIGIGKLLLEEAAKAMSGRTTVLLMCIEDNAAISAEELDALKTRYPSLGYHYTHLAHYLTPLKAVTAPINPPPGVRFEPMKGSNRDDLAACILDAFSGPADRFLFGESSGDQRDQVVAGLLDAQAAQESTSAVAYAGNEAIGFVSAIGNDSNLLIDWLGVRPSWQRQGLGTLLLHHAMSQGVAAGYTTASGSANVANTPSIRLLESLGWQREDEERQFVRVL